MAENSGRLEQQTGNQRDLVLCGRYVPEPVWSNPGTGVLWLQKAADNTVLMTEQRSEGEVRAFNNLKAQLFRAGIQDFREEPDEGGIPTLVLSGLSFVQAVQWLSDESSGWNLSSDLALLIRLQRFARTMVIKREVVPYAAPAEVSVAEVYQSCLRAALADEDGWSYWSSHTEEYVGHWLPSWIDEKAAALRMSYVARADELWQTEWNPRFPWNERDHGQMLTDIWLWLCVDYFVRPLLVSKNSVFATEDEPRHGFRVSYRGEDEVVQRWKKALGEDLNQTAFAADGWLVWRILKQSFQGTGWRQELLTDRSGRAFYHLEFELIPPLDETEVSWRLKYYLVHNYFKNRASLEEWWRQPERTLAIGQDVLRAADEWFLPDLLRAGEVCHPIQVSLEVKAPFECRIASEMVLEVVTKQFPQMKELGFSVYTPELDANQVMDVKIRVQVQRVKNRNHAAVLPAWSQTGGGWFNANQLVDFDWKVVIGDKEIAREEFEQMVERRTSMIQLDGSWRLIPLDAILNQVRELSGGSRRGSIDLMQFSRTVLMAKSEAEEGISIDLDFNPEAEEAQGMLELLEHADAAERVAPPKGFKGVLRHYQSVGYSWLIHLRKFDYGGCLADDMGLGKTIQVLAYLQFVKEQGLQRAPHLLVCPTSLLQNWRAEIMRFTPDLNVYIHHGANRNAVLEDYRGTLQAATEKYDVVMTTYATILRDQDEFIHQHWDVFVLDEAQNIKNAHTKQAQAVRKIHAMHRIALTGTPVENRLEELWSIFHFTNPGYLGSSTWFRKEFAEPIASHPQSLAARKLQTLLRPVLLRRHKSDPEIQVELPEKWEVREYSSLTTEQAALYQSFVNRLFEGVGRQERTMSRRGQILAALVRLKQVCDHPCLVTGGSTDTERSGKMQLLLDMLQEITDDGESALVFTQFRDMGELLCDAMEQRFGWRPKFLHGGQSAQIRGEIVEGFQSRKDKAPVLVLSLKAGGVGLNLTRANHVFHFDRWWNPAVEDQATDRAFRIGQTKDVQVHKLVCLGTLEERIDTLIESKRVLSASIVGDSEAWLTELDDEELRGLFALNAEAAVESDRSL